jgi:hypothetical protein
MPTNPAPNDLAKTARFVFRGTVQRLNATTVEDVHDTSRTAVVRVDETIQAPKSLSHYTGRDVTVKLQEGSDLKAGDQVVFFTDAWLFGNTGVAVRSLGHHAPGPGTALRSNQDPVANLSDRDMQTHFEDADMVVTGTVTGVRVPDAARRDRVPSEHDPQWREAVVEVDRVYKGKPEKQEVLVRFPASVDRMWYRAPKLEVQSRGHFMLHRWSPDLGKKTLAEGPAAGDYYMVLHPEDFERTEHPGALSRLLQSRA